MTGNKKSKRRFSKNYSKLGFLIISSLVFVFGIFIYGFNNPYDSSFDISDSISIPNVSSVKILVAGDLMLDRNVRNLINRNGFDSFFGNVKPLVQSADIAVANLEGTFTTNESVTADLRNKELQFTFDPALAPAVSDLGFDVLGLGNNHSYNFGKAGLESTRRYIGRAGMTYYGDPFNKDEISTIITKNGIKVGIVGFHEFYYTNFDKVFLEITRLRPIVDVLIVTPHWGVEYDKKPTEKMKEWGHEFIDLGADAMIGAHPHVIGDVEEYKGKKIFYSLGNFAFDQYFREDTMKGLVVLMNAKKDKDTGGVSIDYDQVFIKVDEKGISLIE